MRTHSQTFEAGETRSVTVNGNFFVLLDASGPVDLEFEFVGASGATDICRGIEAGYSEQFVEQITAVHITSASAQTVKYGYARGVVKFDRSVIITQQSSATDNIEPVTLNAVADVVLPGDSGRRRVIFAASRDNVGDIALGGPSLTAANAARWLSPGEAYIENDAAGAPVYALADNVGDVVCIEVA